MSFEIDFEVEGKTYVAEIYYAAVEPENGYPGDIHVAGIEGLSGDKEFDFISQHEDDILEIATNLIFATK
jgi:hypothetical protein